ncbi:MAG: hypothetical protein LC624_08910 [Halobacteriales archaeon]|nr:hypothetical protein [Halobacteriales archaeon]
MLPHDLGALAARLHRALEPQGLAYVLVGQAAAAHWGASVPVEQLDVLVKLDPGQADRLLAGAEAQGFEAESGLAALAVEQGDHLSLFSPGAEAFVDVKAARGAGDMAALRTRLGEDLGGERVSVATREECIARLLDAGSEPDLDAARELLGLHGAELDRGYLGQRCEELHVAHLLHELVDEVPA